MQVTIKDIANRAGVSIGTVDRVLKNRSGVSEKTKQKVLDIIEELNYVPNIAGKALRFQKNPMVIGAVINAETRNITSKLVKDGVALAAQELGGFGVKVKYFFVNTFDPKEQLQILKEIPNSDLSGVLIKPLNDKRVGRAINEIVEKGIPVVTCTSDIQDTKRLCFVGQNLVKDGRVAANLLSKMIYNPGKVVILNDAVNLLAPNQRIRGFCDYIAQKVPDLDVLISDQIIDNEERAYETTQAVIASNPDIKALFVQTSFKRGVCKAIETMGMTGKIIVFSFEPSHDMLDLIREEKIDFCIEGDLFSHGYMAFKILFEYLFYEKYPKGPFVEIPSNIRIAENIKD